MPYEKFEFKPGELITAERMNAMQDAIKGDIQGEIETASEQIKKTGVDKATNAEKFDAKTSKEWTDALDQRYSPKVHDHEGQAVYKRYFKQLRTKQPIVLEHKLGRFPIVDIYKLESIPVATVETEAKSTNKDTKFYLYYHHEERDQNLLLTEDRGMVRWPWGIPLEQLLTEYDVKWELDDSLGDVINDFLDAFFKPPAVDHMEHKLSPWIEDHKEKSIGYLNKRDEWPDIRWVIKPEKVAFVPAAGTAGVANDRISVIHLSYDTLAVTAELADQEKPIDLMILLRS